MKTQNTFLAAAGVAISFARKTTGRVALFRGDEGGN